MLSVQVDYWKNVEAARHNNQMELQNYYDYLEAQRHNKAMEAEQHRANVAQEDLKRSEIINARNKLELERRSIGVQEYNARVAELNAITNRLNARTTAYSTVNQVRQTDTKLKQDYIISSWDQSTKSRKVSNDYYLGLQSNAISIISANAAVSNAGANWYKAYTDRSVGTYNAETQRINARTNQTNAETNKIGIWANAGSKVVGAAFQTISKFR